MSETPEPIACPFCGSLNVEARGMGLAFYVTCHGCVSTSRIASSPKEAIAAWNRRTSPDPLLEALRQEPETALLTAAKGVLTGIISGGSGPVAPCFDASDYACEAKRGSWSVIDQKAIDALRVAVKGGTQ